MVKAYEAKLAEFVIPVEELGFDPLVPTNVEWLLSTLYWTFDFLLTLFVLDSF